MRMKSWDYLCRLLTAADIDTIASSDYGDNFAEHKQQILRIIDLAPFFSLKTWEPLEVLRLTRWRDINDATHGQTALCAHALLIGAFHQESHEYQDSINENIIILIESSRFLPDGYLPGLSDFFTTCIQRNATIDWEEETPFLYLGQSLAGILEGNIAPGTLMQQGAFETAIQRSIDHHLINDRRPLHITDLSVYNQRNHLWYSNIKACGLSGCHDLLTPTARYQLEDS